MSLICFRKLVTVFMPGRGWGAWVPWWRWSWRICWRWRWWGLGLTSSSRWGPGLTSCSRWGPGLKVLLESMFCWRDALSTCPMIFSHCHYQVLRFNLYGRVHVQKHVIHSCKINWYDLFHLGHGWPEGVISFSLMLSSVNMVCTCFMLKMHC